MGVWAGVYGTKATHTNRCCRGLPSAPTVTPLLPLLPPPRRPASLRRCRSGCRYRCCLTTQHAKHTVVVSGPWQQSTAVADIVNSRQKKKNRGRVSYPHDPASIPNKATNPHSTYHDDGERGQITEGPSQANTRAQRKREGVGGGWGGARASKPRRRLEETQARNPG